MAVKLSPLAPAILSITPAPLESVESVYDLTQISNCRLHQSELTDKDSDINKIGFLRLQFNDAKTQPVDLIIYKMKKNLAYTEEESKAKKLVKDIKSML